MPLNLATTEDVAEVHARIDALAENAASKLSVAMVQKQVDALDGTAAALQQKIDRLEQALTLSQQAGDQQVAALDARIDRVLNEVLALGEALHTHTHTALPDADVTVEVGAQIGVSRLEAGVSHVSKDLIGTTNAAAKERAKANLAPALAYHNVHIQAFGSNAILAADGTPTWGSLDSMAGQAVQMGGKLVLTFHQLPWQYRGVTTFANGVQTTTNLISADEWTDKGRLRTDRIPVWSNLVYEVAKRYMQAPYNCRVFQIGNEMKGFQNRARDARGQAWDWDDHPGTPGHADMGYTAYYKLTLGAILQAATSLGIAHSSIKIGGPYPVISAQGVVDADSVPVGHPLRERSWGTANRMGVDAVTGFLDLQRAQGFKMDHLSIDFGTFLKDGTIVDPDDFAVAYNRFSDYLKWARTTLTGKGYAPDFPLVISEWYAKPQAVTGAGKAQYRAAIKAAAMIAMLEQGVWLPLAWSPFGDGDGPNIGSEPNAWEGGMVTRPTSSEGGQPLPFLAVLQGIRTHFPPGTPLYAVTCSDGRVRGIASPTHAFVVNQTAGPLAVRVGNRVVDLAPYADTVVDR